MRGKQESKGVQAKRVLGHCSGQHCSMTYCCFGFLGSATKLSGRVSCRSNGAFSPPPPPPPPPLLLLLCWRCAMAASTTLGNAAPNSFASISNCELCSAFDARASAYDTSTTCTHPWANASVAVCSGAASPAPAAAAVRNSARRLRTLRRRSRSSCEAAWGTWATAAAVWRLAWAPARVQHDTRAASSASSSLQWQT